MTSGRWRHQSPRHRLAVAFGEAYRLLMQRISIFASLPIAGLDKLSLQSKLRDIGRIEGATGRALSDT